MKVTDEMLTAAVRQAVKDGILPEYASEEQYTYNYACVKRMLQTALNVSEEIKV